MTHPILSVIGQDTLHRLGIATKRGIKYSLSIPFYEIEVKFGPLTNHFPKFVYLFALLLIANANVPGLGNIFASRLKDGMAMGVESVTL
jgi:hypothetical protein